MVISKFDSVFSKNNKEVKAPTALRKKLNLSAPRGYSYELMEGTKDMYVLCSKKSRQENSFQVRIKFPLEFEGMTIHSIDELVEAMYRTQKVFKLDESPFQYRFAGLKMTIKQNDRLLLNDFLVCDPLEDDMGEIGFFEGYKNYNSVTIIDPLLTQKHVDQFREVLASIDTDCRYGVTQIDSGVVLRVLGPNYHENRRLIWLFTNFYREEIKIFSPINLRKPDVHIR